MLMCGQSLRETWEVEDGSSLMDVMLTRNPELKNWPMPTICIFAGNPVLRAEWKSTKLKGRDVAVFVELPLGGGGGSNPLQAIFTVALVVASFAAPYLAPASWGTLSAAGVVTWKGALLSAGVMMAGSIVSSMAFSQPSGQLGASQAEQSSPTYSLNGSGNAARLYQVEPEGFGKMLVVPDIIAQQWSQYIANDMFLYQVFGCGRGAYDVHELSFGDVVFWKDGAIIESAYSTESGEQYTNVIDEELVQVVDGGDWHGPYRAVGEGENARTINVTFSFPDGLAVWERKQVSTDDGIDYEWVMAEAAVTLVLEARKIGDDAWMPLAEKNFSKATQAAFTELVSGKMDVYGTWEIRARNESEIPEQSTSSDSVISSSKANLRRVVLSNVSTVSVPVYVQFVPEGETVTLFPDNVETSGNVASQELLAPNDADYAVIGPFAANSPGTKITQILLSYVAPSGLGRYDDDGSLLDYSVSIVAECQRIDDSGEALSDWRTLRQTTMTAGTLTAQRRTETCAVESGRYHVRVRRSSNKRTDNRAVETVQWESMIAVIPGSLTYGQSAIAVKLKATNLLSQSSANDFKVLQTRRLPLYDRASKSWSDDTPTRSFAAAMSAVVKARLGGNLADRQIDLDSLWSIGEELEKKGWHYDAWIDGAYVVWDLVTEMCTAYRIVPRAAGSVLTFVQDKSGRPVRHVFTPYDIVRDSFQPSWTTYSDETPDDVLVSYLDEEAGYVQRDVRAMLPDSESRKTANQEYLGVTSRELAYRAGMFKAACNRYRRLGCEFETEGVGRNLNLGDVVSVTHPRFRNADNGVLKGWDEAALLLELDRDVQPAEGVTPYLSLCRPDGTPWGPVKLLWIDEGMARFDPADYAALTMQGLESPFSWLTTGNDRVPTVWTLHEGRDFSRRCIITAVTPQSMYRYKITCINDDERVDSFDDCDVPPWEYRSSLPTYEGLSQPENLNVTVTKNAQGQLVSATWDEVRGATGYEVQYGADGINWTRFGQVNVSSVAVQMGSGTVWLRVAAVRVFEQSGWSIWH